MKAATEPLSRILERSGVFRDVEGNSLEPVLRESLLKLPLPETVDFHRLLASVLEREAMGSTAIGGGLAIPHCRDESLAELPGALVSLNYPIRPLPVWGTDTQTVAAFFLILCPDAVSHLQVVADLSALMRKPGFMELIGQKAGRSEIVSFARIHEEESFGK